MQLTFALGLYKCLLVIIAFVLYSSNIYVCDCSEFPLLYFASIYMFHFTEFYSACHILYISCHIHTYIQDMFLINIHTRHIHSTRHACKIRFFHQTCMQQLLGNDINTFEAEIDFLLPLILILSINYFRLLLSYSLTLSYIIFLLQEMREDALLLTNNGRVPRSLPASWSCNEYDH